MIVLCASNVDLGNNIAIDVSNDTQPGALHDFCITITHVPVSKAMSGMHSSANPTTCLLCRCNAKFSLVESMKTRVTIDN